MAKDTKNTEMEADAWSAFERAVDVVVKAPPQHRTAASPESAWLRGVRAKADKASSGRVPFSIDLPPLAPRS